MQKRILYNRMRLCYDGYIYEKKYAPTKELADQADYFGVSGDEVTIYLDDEQQADENGKLVLATTTYNGGIFPFMREFIDHLTERGYQKRTMAFIENGSWAPTAARNMAKMLENSKDIEQVGTATIRSAMTDENKAQLDEIAKKLA